VERGSATHSDRHGGLGHDPTAGVNDEYGSLTPQSPRGRRYHFGARWKLFGKTSSARFYLNAVRPSTVGPPAGDSIHDPIGGLNKEQRLP